MKTYLIPAIFLLALAACGNKPKPELNSVKFPPPVEKEVREFKAKPKLYASHYAGGDVELDDKSFGYMSNSNNVKPSNNTTISDTSKKVIKTGDISFETKDITATRKALLNRLKKMGGYLDEDNESINSESDRKEYTLKTRIPAKNFDLFLDSVASDAVKVDSKNISISDVTVQYIDMSTRLQNKKLLEARYLDLLKQANKMADVLAVENKLNDVRTEIESAQGQLNYLNKQIAYSSLDITFYVSHLNGTYAASTTFSHQFNKALSRGLDYVKKVFFGIIALWPLWITGTVAYLIVRRIRRRRAMSRNSATTSA